MVAQKLISAEHMGRAVLFDPQFAMPQRPHFPRDLMVVPLKDGLLIEGAADQQVLRGKATKRLLPRLLPLLDGKRTLEEVAQALPDTSIEVVFNMIALLYTRGLLEDSTADPADFDAKSIDPQVLSYFRRHVDTTRVNQSALQSLARLASAQIAVLAYGPHTQETCAEICTQLQQTGVGMVNAIAWGTDLKVLLEKPADRRLVLVLVEGQEDQALFQELDEQCARYSIPWLRVGIDPKRQIAEMGPYFERGETACYRCFARANAEFVEESEESEGANGFQVKQQLAVRIWAQMLVLEAVYLLSRIAPPSTGIHVMQYNLEDWSNQRIDYPRLPGCSICRPAPVEMGYIEPALVYEDSVAFASRHLLDPKDHQVHYRASNMELAHEGKRYPGNPRVALSPREHLAGASGSTLECLPGSQELKAPAQPLNVDALASLLLKGAGVRHDDGVKTSKLQRWSPTGGNLGSVELYVVVSRVEGLAPGVYFYQSQDHMLAYLRQMEREEYASLLQGAILTDSGTQPDALILSVGAYHRVGHKYSTFAYRVINLDAGVALAQMHMVAHSLGISAQTVQRWADDVMVELLDLEDIQEMVTAALALYSMTEGR